MKTRIWVTWLIAGLYSLAAVAGESGPKKGNVVISPLAAWIEQPDEAGLDDDVAPGIALGWVFSDRWMAEILYVENEPDFALGGASGEAEMESAWLNLTHLYANESRWQPYFTLGGGRTTYNYPPGTADRNDDQYNAGLGFFANITQRVALRADARGVYSSDTGDVEPFAFLGLSLTLGRMTPPTPPDQDGDGVPDDRDRCPDTPPGTRVGSDGCELDQDGDGVPDGSDSCPNTPAGVAVDRSGCPLDSDGDGVPDHRDKCPGSEAGARVDQDGCYVELEEAVTMNMQLEFDLNSAELRPAHRAELDKVVAFLREYPVADAVIEGHTDSSGAADYNLTLSKRRADSVLRFLVGQGIDTRRLSSAGFGEERPIADNSTSAGRQLNRRVSAVISATRKVRQ